MLEAKDTKKIQGQGQPFQGQTLSRPRTGMLEAKAKDQGHRRKCFPKKKVFKNFFQAISKKGKQKRFSQIFREVSGVFLLNFKNEQISTDVETDANAHHAIWGSPDINPLGKDLLAYCVSADLDFCNVDNNPIFRTKTREEIQDLTLVNRCAWDRVVGWHVSNVLLFSDHMYIRFQIKSRIQNQARMFQNVCRTYWNKHVDELEQKLSERILPPVQVPSSKEHIVVLANKVHSVITKSYEVACPMRKSLRKKANIWWNSELASLRKKLVILGKKPLKQNKKKIGRLKRSLYPISKQLTEEQSAVFMA